MSSYHTSFKYLNKNSVDEGWLIVHFDADNGEMDSYLSQEQVYADSYNGVKRILYGTKWNAVANIKITVIKRNGTAFSIDECRRAYRWLTGNPQASWLQLYVGDESRYEFLCTVQDVKPQKMDARTIALNIYFESISPWAYSSVQSFSCSFGQELGVDNGVLFKGDAKAKLLDVDGGGVLYNGTEGGAGVFQVTDSGIVHIDNSVLLQIDNQTDDLYTPVYLYTKFTNDNSDYLSIRNKTSNEETVIKNMSQNEVITLSSEQFITSNYPNKIFGESFNFIWPKLIPGKNEIVVSGSGCGQIDFSYRYPIKIGDCAIDLDTIITETVCDIACSVDEIELRSMLQDVLWSEN